MKKIIIFIFTVCTCISCSSEKAPTSQLISKELNNTSWYNPRYTAAQLNFKKDTIDFVKNAYEANSNQQIVLIDEDLESKFVVFQINDENSTNIYGVQIIDLETITFSPLPERESLEVYKKNHDILNIMLKKTNY